MELTPYMFQKMKEKPNPNKIFVAPYLINIKISVP